MYKLLALGSTRFTSPIVSSVNNNNSSNVLSSFRLSFFHDESRGTGGAALRSSLEFFPLLLSLPRSESHDESQHLDPDALLPRCEMF